MRSPGRWLRFAASRCQRLWWSTVGPWAGPWDTTPPCGCCSSTSLPYPFSGWDSPAWAGSCTQRRPWPGIWRWPAPRRIRPSGSSGWIRRPIQCLPRTRLPAIWPASGCRPGSAGRLRRSCIARRREGRWKWSGYRRTPAGRCPPGCSWPWGWRHRGAPWRRWGPRRW